MQGKELCFAGTKSDPSLNNVRAESGTMRRLTRSSDRVVTAALVASALVAGCVPLPVPVEGSVDRLDVPPALSSPMSAGDTLAILDDSVSDDDEIVSCVRSATAKADATLHLLPPKEFRDALFPSEPSTALTDENIAHSLSQPAVKAKISALNLRYAVLVSGGTIESDMKEEAPLYMEGKRSSWVQGRILDLTDGGSPGELSLSVSGTNAFVWLPYVAPYILAMTETPACHEFGRQLAAYLTGKPAPKPKSAHTEAPDE